MAAADRGLHKFRDAVLSENGPEDMGAKLVAIVMAKFADRRTCETFVGAETVAKCSGMNERTVRRHREQLEASGWLTSQASRRRGRGRQWHLQVPSGIPDKSSGNPARFPGNFDTITGQKRQHYRTNRPPIPSPDPLLRISGSASAPPDLESEPPTRDAAKRITDRIKQRLAAGRAGGAE